MCGDDRVGSHYDHGVDCEVHMRYFQICVEFDTDANVPKLETTIRANDYAEAQNTAAELFPQAVGIAIWEV